MSPQCSQPDLQMEVLKEARDAETLPSDLALHLEECVACQTGVGTPEAHGLGVGRR